MSDVIYSGTPDADGINAAIASNAANNAAKPNYPVGAERLIIPALADDASYMLTRPLSLLTKSHIVATGAKFLRKLSVAAQPLCITSEIGTEDASWEGGTFTRELQPAVGTTPAFYENGGMINAIGDRLTFKDVTVVHWQNGGAFSIRGDDIVLINPVAQQPVMDLATGGIRVFGGSRFRCVGGSIEAYDDALAFAPGPASGYDLGDRKIEDGAFIGTTVIGTRVINASLGADGPTNPDTGEWAHSDLGRYATASVRNVRFIGITATATGVSADNPEDTYGRAVKVVNESSGGIVDGVTISDCKVTCAWRVDRPVVIGNYAGGVANVAFNNVDILSDGQTQYNARQPVEVFRVDGLTWRGGRIDGPGFGAQPTIQLHGVRNAHLADLTIDATAGDTILLDGSDVVPDGDFHIEPRICQNVTIENCRIRVAPSFAGVRMNMARGCSANRNSFTLAGTSPTLTPSTRAIVIADGTSFNTAQFNLLSALEQQDAVTNVRPIEAPGLGNHWLTPNDVVSPANFDLGAGSVKATKFAAQDATLTSFVPQISAGNVEVLRLAPTAPDTIGSMLNTEPGRFMTLANVGSATLTIVDSAAGAGVRKFLLGGANRPLPAGQAFTVWYDSAAQGWRAID